MKVKKTCCKVNTSIALLMAFVAWSWKLPQNSILLKRRMYLKLTTQSHAVNILIHTIAKMLIYKLLLETSVIKLFTDLLSNCSTWISQLSRKTWTINATDVYQKKTDYMRQTSFTGIHSPRKAWPQKRI